MLFSTQTISWEKFLKKTSRQHDSCSHSDEDTMIYAICFHIIESKQM